MNRATKTKIAEIEKELAHWNRIAELLGEGWSVYGWNSLYSASFRTPLGDFQDVGRALSVSLGRLADKL